MGIGPYKGWESAQTTYSIYQSIELGGKRGARTKFADSQAGVAFWDAQITRQNLRYELATVFINTYIAQEKVKPAKERELIAERTLSIVEAQVIANCNYLGSFAAHASEQKTCFDVGMPLS